VNKIKLLTHNCCHEKGILQCAKIGYQINLTCCSFIFFFLVIKPLLNILCKQLLYLAWAKFRFSLLIVCFSQLLTFSTRSLSILLNFCAKQKRHKNIKTKIKITNLFSSIFLELFRLREFCICSAWRAK